jgi:Carboxypeptidase regulatory-like domain
MTKKALLVLLFCCVVLSICPFMYGQANGGFSGTVSDKTGSVISGATVTVTSQGTGLSRETKTDDTGHYLTPLLPVGNYTIRVNSQGFKAVAQTDIRLQVNEQREVNFTLVPGSVTEAVEVSATEVAVETSTPTLGQVITAEQVADLPLNGRDFVQLATLTPGTTQETNPQSFFNNGLSSEVSARGTYSLSVGGSRAQSTDWLFDGNDNNELTAGGISILPSIDAIQEFKVLTYNYSAEYGTRAGPTVLVTTKSGSNALHGSVFEFFRNTKLDARSFFAPTREQRNLNQFGGAVGGPIQKDKTFFFVDYQGRRQRYGVPFVGLIPTPAMKTGDYTLDPFGTPRGASNPNGFSDLVNPYTFTAFQCDPITGAPLDALAGGVQPTGVNCNKIPANMINPTGQAMMNFYPNANASNAAVGFNFTNIPTRRLDEGEFDVRLDHNFSSKDSAFARFSYDQATSFAPGGGPPGFAEQGAFASSVTFANHGRNVALSETHVFSDRTINQISGGFNRIFNHITGIAAGSCLSAKIGIQGANLSSACDSITGYPPSLNQSTKDCESCGLSSTIVGNYWSLGDRGFAPFQGGTNVFSISDSFDMIRGKHDIRIGGQVRANQLNVRAEAFQDGFLIPFGISGDASADLLMGQIGLGIHDQTFQGATTGRRWKVFRPFVQDDWRVTNNLTLNLGLAWAIVTPTTETQNRQANFDVASAKLFVAGSASIAGCTLCIHSDPRLGIQLDKTALEPRIGLAWKPLGSEKSVVRAGYAIYHDTSWNLGGQGLWQNPPYLIESQNFAGVPTCPFGNSTSPNPVNCGIERVFLQANLQPIMTPPNPDTFPGSVLSQNRDFKQGMIQQYNLNVERQLPGNVVLTAGYAGSYSTHILVNGMNLAIHSPDACPGGMSPVPGYTFGCGYVKPNAPFGVISNVNDVGRARYNSLQIKAETKSARHGLYALFGYTYSRTFDSGFPDGLGTPPGATYWPLPGAQRADWALSQLNLNHSFTASVLYDLPFGKGKQFGSSWRGPVNAILGNWEVDVIEKATTGFPLYIVDSTPNSTFTSNASGSNFLFNGAVSLNRPDQIADPNKAGPVPSNPDPLCQMTISQGGRAADQVHSLSSWFNPCAFVSAPVGELGLANRAPVYGPRFVNTDFSAIKHFPIRESMQLDFRAEFFNIFNHPQFGLTGSSATGMQDVFAPSTFSQVNQTVHDPRVIQFALKLRF